MRWFRWFLLFTVLAYLLSGVKQIGYDERAVVKRFGAVVARPGPGLWLGLPWGIDRVERVQVRAVRQLAVGYSPENYNEVEFLPGQFLTGDQNLVNCKLVVEYTIDETGTDIDNYLLNRSVLEVIVTRETEAIAAEWAASRTVDVVLSDRTGLALHLSHALPERLQPHRLGMVVQRVSVDYLAAPEEVRDAFEAVNQAQTAIRTRRNQAEQDAARQINDATALATRLANEAVAYQHEQRSAAEAEATAFTARLAQYQQASRTNPAVLSTIWRDEVGKLLLGISSRGRIEVMDDVLGPAGLELNQFVPSKR